METVKIYVLSLDVIKNNIDAIEKYIDKNRLKKANRIKNENEKYLSYGASFLLNKYIGSSINYTKNEYGKPGIEGIYFNISHSKDMVVMAIAKENEVGIDIEKDAMIKDNLIKYCLSDEESTIINEKNQFLDFFVAKESLSKAYGTGLALGIKEIPALPFDGEVRYKEKTFFRHKMRIEGYFGSVSLENDDFSIEYEGIKEIV